MYTESESSHFLLVGVVGFVVDGCICACGFSVNAKFCFISLSVQKKKTTFSVMSKLCFYTQFL